MSARRPSRATAALRRDVAIGLLLAVVLVVLGPGVGLSAVFAVLALVLIAVSYGVERLWRRRSGR